MKQSRSVLLFVGIFCLFALAAQAHEPDRCQKLLVRVEDYLLVTSYFARPYLERADELGVSSEEVLAAGNLGLVLASHQYEPSNGAFPKFAGTFIRLEIEKLLESEGSYGEHDAFRFVPPTNENPVSLKPEYLKRGELVRVLRSVFGGVFNPLETGILDLRVLAADAVSLPALAEGIRLSLEETERIETRMHVLWTLGLAAAQTLSDQGRTVNSRNLLAEIILTPK